MNFALFCSFVFVLLHVETTAADAALVYPRSRTEWRVNADTSVPVFSRRPHSVWGMHWHGAVQASGDWNGILPSSTHVVSSLPKPSIFRGDTIEDAWLGRQEPVFVSPVYPASEKEPPTDRAVKLHPAILGQSGRELLEKRKRSHAGLIRKRREFAVLMGRFTL